MRVGFLLLLVLGLSLAPYVLGARALAAGPRYLIALSLLTLAGIASGTLLLIAAAIDPATLSARDIPEAVGHCIDAAGRLLSHPIQHWPRILAALVLLAAIVRLTIGAVATVRDARRGRLPPTSLPGERELSRRLLGVSPADIRVVPDPSRVAYTTGLFRRQIVVSTGLLRSLDPAERDAVIAHERAHVHGRHMGLMFAGRVVGAAFGFLPPVRTAARQLLFGLEAVADDRAAEAVGSRVLVARAIATLCDVAVGARTLGAGSSDVVRRVSRLTAAKPPGGRGAGLRGRSAVTIAVAMVLAQAPALLLLAPSPSRGAQQLHAVCDLPDGTEQVA